MPFEKGAKPGPGRPKGLQNKNTLSVKAALHQAFDLLGGVRALFEWAGKNPSEFYKLWGRMIPTEITGADGKDLLPPTQDDRENLQRYVQEQIKNMEKTPS